MLYVFNEMITLLDTNHIYRIVFPGSTATSKMSAELQTFLTVDQCSLALRSITNVLYTYVYTNFEPRNTR